ncbi:TOMM precursor leader peptide-binding protein [Micromonospora sp. NPDC051196]|uniref:TOMM precursor leader peptide-binding protein n=1 Tax=Micromonospora sp. NPDC051196 TaxID=3155281 RepID=UPI00343B5C1C
MTIRPRVRRNLRVENVPGEAVYVFSERGHQVIEGELTERVMPLLDGKHDVDDVLDALDDEPPERVLFLIERLVRMGIVLRVDPELPQRESAFWDMAGSSAEVVADKLSAATVGLSVVGEVDPEPLLAALGAAGLRVRPAVAGGTSEVDLSVVATDNYLNPELAEQNDAALRSGRPWLLTKPIGSVLWIGPTFKPASRTHGCWACVAFRLAGHRQVDEYLRDKLEHVGPLRVPLADLPTTREIGARLTALEAVKHLAGLATEQEDGILTLDTIYLDTQRHPLHRRPQCPSCGEPELVARRFAAPVRLASRTKTYTGDGGHRAQRPDEVLARYSPQVSSVTGVVRELRPFATGREFVKGYYAGHNFARRVHNLRHLRSGLRSMAAGKGTTDTQARASAICEAIERYSGLYVGDEPRITATSAELGDRALAPNDLQLYSPRQHENRVAWNAAQRSSFQIVCDPLPADRPIEWSPVWSLTHERHFHVPTAHLYFQYPSRPGELFASACSNGNAAGSSIEDAVLQGFLELVERDSVALWWYNRLNMPRFDLDSFGEPWFDEFREVYAGLNRDLWVLDLTADLGIPVAAAISRRTDKPAEDILMAFGAHLDAKTAVQRALSEMNQFLPAVIDVQPDGTGYAYPDPVQQGWWRHATLATEGYLAPSAQVSTVATHRNLASADLKDDVDTVRGLVERAGMQMLVLDQTRPDLELPVVKVIVPGMRHFWARFGAGRLYDVPVRLGWLDQPTPEDALNPIPMFL